MTKDEISEFVKKSIRSVVGNDTSVWDDIGIDVAVDEIVARWEEDVQNNRDEAFDNGQRNMQEAIYG